MYDKIKEDYNKKYTQNFSGHSKIKIAQNGFKYLERHLAEGSKLTLQDERWLAPLKRYLGADTMAIQDASNPKVATIKDVSLTLEKINQENLTQKNDVAINFVNAENQIATNKETVRFSLKPNKVFLFHPETEERIIF